MRPPESPARPRIIANVAASVDGKIDSVLREGAGFSSRIDRDRMDDIRAGADAIIVGADTIRAENPPLHIKDPARRRRRGAAGRQPDLIVVVVSATGVLPPTARFLKGRAAARVLAVPEDLPDEALSPLADLVTGGALEIFRAGRKRVDLADLVGGLAARGCETLLVEGGGELIAGFLEADLLDELRITFCPTLIGGREAPTPVGGPGWPLDRRKRLRLSRMESSGDELFLVYEIERSSIPQAGGSLARG